MLIITNYHTKKLRKIKIEPRIKFTTTLPIRGLFHYAKFLIGFKAEKKRENVFQKNIRGICVQNIVTFRGTKRLVSVNICSVEGNSADIFVSKVPPGIFVIKVK